MSSLNARKRQGSKQADLPDDANLQGASAAAATQSLPPIVNSTNAGGAAETMDENT